MDAVPAAQFYWIDMWTECSRWMRKAELEAMLLESTRAREEFWNHAGMECNAPRAWGAELGCRSSREAKSHCSCAIPKSSIVSAVDISRGRNQSCRSD